MVLATIWGILVLLAFIWVVVDVVKSNKTSGMKILWIIIALILGIIGAIAYYLFGRK